MSTPHDAQDNLNKVESENTTEVSDDGGLIDETPSSSSSKTILLWGLIVLVAIGAFAFMGKLSGTGWFGYRSWMYEGGELYILNRESKPVLASVDGFQDVEVPADNAQRLDLVGGESVVVIKDAETGEELSRHTVTLDGFHALLKLKPKEDCLAVVDVSSYYSGQKGAMPKVMEQISTEDQLYYFKTRNVVWPRKDFPPHIDPAMGSPVWAEIVGCELFDDKEFLESYLGFRLSEAFKKMQQGSGAPTRE